MQTQTWVERGRKNWGKILVVGLILVGGYYWYERSHATSTETQYITAVAEKGTLTTSISASGNITVDSEANVDPTISGTVTSLLVKVGDIVKKGDRLFTIDNDDLAVAAAKSKSSYLSAQQNVLSAIATSRQTESDIKNAEKTSDERSTLGVLYKKRDAAKAGVVTAEQNLVAAKADYANQLNEAAKRNVKAPIDGTVNEVNIKNGDDLGSFTGSAKVTPIIIGDLGTLQVTVDVSEVDIISVELGQRVQLTLDAIPDFTMTGKVSAIDSLGTNSQGVVNYSVTIDLDVLDPRLKPGMSVTASIITGVKENVLLVPNVAVKSDSNGKYVQVLDNGTPIKKGVTVGLSNTTETEIKSGLNPNEAVVTQTITAGASTTATPSQGGSLFRLPGVGGGATRTGNAH